MDRALKAHRLDFEVSFMKLFLGAQALNFLQEFRVRLVEVRVGYEDWCTYENITSGSTAFRARMFAHKLTVLTRTYILQTILSFIIIFIKAFVVFILAAINISRQQIQISINTFEDELTRRLFLYIFRCFYSPSFTTGLEYLSGMIRHKSLSYT